ncbi:MAG: DUF2269 family protein [Actinomycetota bacterium]
MYQWWVLLHIVGVIGFLLSHGASVTLTFQLRREREPAKVAALIAMSQSTYMAFYVSLLLLLVGGVVAGFIGGWWSKGWIWLSLILLVASGMAMAAMAKPFYGKVAKAARIQASGGAPIPGQDLFVLLSSHIPIVIAWIGFITLLAIAYLMVMKPF